MLTASGGNSGGMSQRGCKKKKRKKGGSLGVPPAPSMAVQTRPPMTKTSSSVAGVGLRVCLRQTGTLQQEEIQGGGEAGLKEKRKAFAEKRDKRRSACRSAGQ